MKYLWITIFSLCGLSLQAQELPIQTLFWRSYYPLQPKMELVPLQPGVAADCRNFENFLLKQADEISEEDLDFSRTLPLAGQMQNTYEVDFEIKMTLSANKRSVRRFQPADFYTEGTFELVPSTLKDIRVPHKDGTLTGVSTRLGLKPTSIELIAEQGQWPLIKISGRDVVCDLLSNKLALTANAQARISLNQSDLHLLSRFYKEIEEKTSEIFANHAYGDYAKAALLGLSYSEIFERYEMNEVELKKNLKFLFESLFYPDSLRLNTNWVRSGNKNVIDFQPRKELGFAEVIMNVGSM